MPVGSIPQDANNHLLNFQYANGDPAAPLVDAADNLSVVLADSDASIGTVTLGEGDANIGTVSLAATSGGGAVPLEVADADDTAQSVKDTPGTLYYLSIINGSGATAYVGLYDAAAADVVVGTTPLALQIQVADGDQVLVPLPIAGTLFDTAIAVGSATAAGGAVGSDSGVDVYVQYV